MLEIFILIFATVCLAVMVAAASPLALPGVLAIVGLVHNPGRLLPGLEGVHESQRQTFQYGAAVTTHQFTFLLEGSFTALSALAVAPGAWISAKSGGSASAAVSSVVIDSVSLTEVKVTCTIDAAPGAGETTTVACGLVVAGPGPE